MLIIDCRLCPKCGFNYSSNDVEMCYGPSSSPATLGAKLYIRSNLTAMCLINNPPAPLPHPSQESHESAKRAGTKNPGSIWRSVVITVLSEQPFTVNVKCQGQTITALMSSLCSITVWMWQCTHAAECSRAVPTLKLVPSAFLAFIKFFFNCSCYYKSTNECRATATDAANNDFEYLKERQAESERASMNMFNRLTRIRKVLNLSG